MIDQSAAQTNAWTWDLLNGRIKDRYEMMKKNGITIVTDVPQTVQDALRTAAQPEIDKWLVAVGPDGRAILDKLASGAGQ